MPFKKIKVLIVDDSLFFRAALEDFLKKDSFIDVVGSCENAFAAEEKIKQLEPDVVTLDVEMPGMSGSEFLKKIMLTNPLPIVLVSSLSLNVFEALEAGAVDFVKKPENTDKNKFNSFFSQLSTKIKIASTVKFNKRTALNLAAPMKLKEKNNKYNLIAIGASTGGTEAILSVIKSLPKECPGIVIVQHMPAGFTSMYAERLNKDCIIYVKEAENGDRIETGKALLAPGGKQMTVEKDSKGFYVKCLESEKVSGHQPSVDVLFTSVATVAGANSIGIILTGMGKDGSEGLLKMKQSGAYTIGQDKATSIVYGMPMESYKIGAVIKQAPLNTITNLIISQLNK